MMAITKSRAKRMGSSFGESTWSLERSASFPSRWVWNIRRTSRSQGWI